VPVLDSLRQRARLLKRDTMALYLACRDSRTPWYAKALAGIIVAYAFSPIDVIPDFIPVLGYLDDLVLIPLGLMVAVKLIPGPVMADCRAQAATLAERPTSRGAAVAIVLVWVLAAAFVVYLVYAALGGA
jgi:uncharacterized membrane protein YkvA (DUF1232 family)